MSLVLKATTAAQLMNAGPVSIADTATVPEASAFLTERGFGAAVVINTAGHAIGVVTKTDILLHARHHGATPADTTPVKTIMTPAVYSVRPDTLARSVVEQLLALGVHHLFVTDAAGVVIGVISPVDVLRKLG